MFFNENLKSDPTCAFTSKTNIRYTHGIFLDSNRSAIRCHWESGHINYDRHPSDSTKWSWLNYYESKQNARKKFHNDIYCVAWHHQSPLIIIIIYTSCMWSSVVTFLPYISIPLHCFFWSTLINSKLQCRVAQQIETL